MSKKEPSVKILVGYHKPAYLLKSDVLVPIHLGRALATEASKDGVMSEEDYQWMLDNMIGDDTGDNTSDLNRYFCEMTGIYWAWKNYDKLGNPDYIGFMHYRSLFRFQRVKSSLDNIIQDFAIDKPHILDSLSDCDLITYNKVPQMYEQTKTYERLKESLDDGLHGALDGFIEENCVRWKNMFIMKKDDFFHYCNFIFPILFLFFEKYPKEPRYVGFISEIVSSFYFYLLEKNKKIKGVEVCNYETFLFPCFKNGIPVVLAADDNYAPYLGVIIKSIIENSNQKNNYDILIFESCISIKNKNKILSLIKGMDNFSIRFISIQNYVKIDAFEINTYFSIETFYRLYIPTILQNFSKIIYLDCDMIVLDDIAKLYAINLDGKVIGATRNYSTIPLYNGNSSWKKVNWKDYFDNELKIKDYMSYFQAGVMVIDVQRMKENNNQEKLIKKSLERAYHLVDQDVLNSYFQGDIKLIDQAWDYEYFFDIYEENRLKSLLNVPDEIYKILLQAKYAPKIIHFDGEKKVWQHPEFNKAEYWWRYARMTPFYEEILYKNLKLQIPNFDGNAAKEILNYSKNKLRYWRYKLLSKVTFGKMRKHYKNKKKELKKRLKQVRKFLKGK